MNLGFFSNDKNEKLSKTDFDLPIELVKIKNNLKIEDDKTSKKDKDDTKVSLKDYAINYANFDKVKIFKFYKIF